MSQQTLYPILGLHGYRVTEVERGEKRLLVHAEPQPHRVCCSQCGSRDVKRRGETKRWIRNLPIGADCTWIIATLPRVECRACGLVRQVKIGLADHRRTFTHSFERYVVELCRHMTIKGVAEHLGVSWDIVKDIHKRHLRKHFSKPPLKHLRHVGIDEICIGRGSFGSEVRSPSRPKTNGAKTLGRSDSSRCSGWCCVTFSRRPVDAARCTEAETEG